MKLLLTLALISSVAGAAPIAGNSLTFDNLQNGEQILSYYAGGFGSQGSGPGPAFGVAFTNGLAADSTSIAFGPSARVTNSSVTMNLDTPWAGIISFYFTGSGSVLFYSGVNAGGNLLGSYSLTNPPFFPFGATPGAFQSAVFVPVSANVLRLDSITFGGTVIPEPSFVSLVAFVLVGAALLSQARHVTYFRQPQPPRD